MNRSVLQVIIETGIKDGQGESVSSDAIKSNGRATSPSLIQIIHDHSLVAAAAVIAAVPNKLKAFVISAELEALRNELEEARKRLLEASS